jgi:hypothetical protein
MQGMAPKWSATVTKSFAHPCGSGWKVAQGIATFAAPKKPCPANHFAF